MSMYPENMFFTSESVTEGHPDKFCDQMSDCVLDECLRVDPLSRVACECYVTMGMLNVGGEITTKALFDVAKVVRDLGNEIGYTAPEVRLRRQYRRHRPDHSRAVTRYQPGRDAGRRADRSRRPGIDVRLRVQSDRRTDAATDHAGASTGHEADRSSQAESVALPRPGRKDTGDRRIPRRQACARRLRGDRGLAHRRGGDRRRQVHHRRGQAGDHHRSRASR